MSFSLLSALTAYMPRDRAAVILDAKRPFSTDGVALIADISGFTPLTEALTQGLRSDLGAEELTRALDTVFTPLITEIHAFQGSVLKFGGDALIVWFGRARRGRRTTVIRRALMAAWRMQQVMQTHGMVPTPIGPVTLRMKIGMAYGPVKRFRLGLPEYGYEDVLVGATLDRMAAAEHQAEPGDIMLDAATWRQVQKDVAVAAWRDGAVVVKELLRPIRPFPWPPFSWTDERESALRQAMAPYVPDTIYETLIAGREQVAELKPVISLFVQFHGLDYDADPHVGHKLQTYFTAAQEVVNRYGGRLNRLITGDKGSLIHIIFGAPRSVEEQEARAVRCALDLQTVCGQLPFITMQRIGLTGGRVFAGPVGSPVRHDYTTMGDAINLSARLMQAAAADQVLLTGEVRAQLGAEFRLDDLGLIQVKGKTESIHIFAAVGIQAQSRPSHAVRLPLLLGREQETAVLQTQVTQLQNGRGRVVILTGDVGLGKTVLLDYLYNWSETQWRTGHTPGLWATGINLAYEQTISGYLFISVLRDLLQLPSGVAPEQTSQRLYEFCRDLFGAEQVEAAYPYLARFMGLPLPEDAAIRLAGMSGESLRWQLFQLVPNLFRRLCQRQPVVLALDDVQWGDPTSLQLVQALLPLTTEAPLLLIVALRSEGRDRIAVQNPIVLVLKELDRKTAVSLIRHHAPNLPSGIVDYLVEKGGGNPLFLVEMVRTLRAQGLLDTHIDLAAVQLDALDLPNSVQGLLLAQLDRLAVQARHTLQLASVIGKTFLHKVLAVISGAEQQLQQVLAELEEQDYIQEAEATNLGLAHRFRHILIQESAYNTLLHERRRDYHRQVAQTLERLFPAQVVEQAGLLAHHYERAGDVETAVMYLLQTADEARVLYAHEEAQALYNHVLTLLTQSAAANTLPNLNRQATTLLKLAQVFANQQAFAQAQTYYEQAFALLDRLRQQQLTLPRHRDHVFRWGVLPEYVERFDPGQMISVENSHLIANLFEGLVELDDAWNVIPAVARRWTVMDDGKTYLFELKPDLRWSDGVPLTAYDFVYAWRRNLDPATNLELAPQLFVVEGAEAVHQGVQGSAAGLGIVARSAHTLEIRLTQPTSSFLYQLADHITFPQPAHAVTALAEAWCLPQNLVCNGAFKPHKSNGQVQFVVNEQYRGFSRSNLARIDFHLAHPSLENYAAAEIDWCRLDDQSDVIRPDTTGEIFRVQDPAFFAVAFSCQSSPFHLWAARAAFAHCIDKEALVAEVWGNVQRAATGGVIPPGIPGHSPEISLPFHPQKGRVLWSEARKALSVLPTTMTLGVLPGFQRTPQFLQRVWKDFLGVDVRIVQDISAEELVGGLQQGAFQLALVGYYLSYPDPADILQGLFYSESPLNFFGWHSEAFDTTLDQAAKAKEVWKRFAYYHEADKILVAADIGVVPLYYLQASGVLRHRFQLADTPTVIRSQGIKFKNIQVVQERTD